VAHPDLPPIEGIRSRELFDTRAAFTEHLQKVVERAQREIWLADRDFADWPLASAVFVDALQGFLRASAANHVRMLVRDPERLTVAQPRFVEVFRVHALTARCRVVPPHAAARFGEACSLAIVDRSLLVRRFHRDQLRGSIEFDPSAARPWLDQLEMLWEESSATLAGTTIGLA
jgi:hypothetical protein